MRKISYICWVASIIVINSGCGNNHLTSQDYEEPIFGQEIQTDIKLLNEDFIFSPGKIGVVDTLIVYSGRTDIADKAFHLFSKISGEYITSFGNIGRARGEVSQASRGFSLDKERGILYVHDAAMGKTLSYSLSKVLAGEMDYVNEIHLPGFGNNIYSFYFLYLKDSFLAGYTGTDRFLVCSETDTIASSDYYPELAEKKRYKAIEQQYYFNAGSMAAKPDGDMFVHATTCGCIMEIWKNEGSTIHPCAVKRFFKPNYLTIDRDQDAPQVQINDNDPMGISSMSCTNQYIYAKYNNTPGYNTNKIAVFDWDGNPCVMYITNNNIATFDVDEDDTVYALAFENEDSPLKLIAIQLTRP